MFEVQDHLGTSAARSERYPHKKISAAKPTQEFLGQGKKREVADASGRQRRVDDLSEVCPWKYYAARDGYITTKYGQRLLFCQPAVFVRGCHSISPCL